MVIPEEKEKFLTEVEKNSRDLKDSYSKPINEVLAKLLENKDFNKIKVVIDALENLHGHQLEIERELVRLTTIIYE